MGLHQNLKILARSTVKRMNNQDLEHFSTYPYIRYIKELLKPRCKMQATHLQVGKRQKQTFHQQKHWNDKQAHEKDVNIMSLKYKAQWDTTTYLSEQLGTRTCPGREWIHSTISDKLYCWPIIVLAGWSSEMESYIHIKACTKLLGAAWFLTAPTENRVPHWGDHFWHPSTVWGTSQHWKYNSGTGQTLVRSPECYWSEKARMAAAIYLMCDPVHVLEMAESVRRELGQWVVGEVEKGWGGKTRGHEAIRAPARLCPVSWTPSRSPFLQSPSTGAVHGEHTGGKVDEANMDLILFHNHEVATVISNHSSLKATISHDGWEWSGSRWK